jgi:hypothetical protein
MIAKIFSLCLAACMPLLAADREPLASQAVVEKISKGIKDAFFCFHAMDSPEREAIRTRAFDGLSDTEKIRGLVEYMFSYPKPGHASIPSEPIQLLHSPKREIQDISELRRLMKKETDSNRFYLLAKFVTLFEADYGESFIAERSRGLLLQGPAAKFGQGQSPYRLKDISYYTYDTIIEDLKKDHSSFVTDVLPSLTGKSESDKVLALAKWLKANWPGCEDLAVPGATNARSSSPETHPDNRNTGSEAVPARKSGATEGAAKEDFPPYRLLVVTLIVATTGVLWLLFKKRK